MSILAALMVVAGAQVLLFALGVPSVPAYLVSLGTGLAVLILVDRRRGR